MNYGMIAYILGWVLKVEAACLALPLICAFIYGETACIPVFLASMAACLAVGIALGAKAPKRRSMFAKEGFTAVALSWIVMSIFGAIPFIASGSIPNFIDALFETASGFTTTGASILNDVESLPRSILLWRSFTHWIGGMGVLVFLVAMLPLSGGENMYLVRAESPGPAVSKLVPKVRTTAKILYLIYLGFTVLEIILLLIGKMELFDAITLSLGTAGTGGFSIKNTGVADYTAYQQWVITIFMVIFGVDFSIYYLILARKIRAAVRSDEVKAYFVIIIIAILIICFNCRGLYANIADTVRHSAFQVGAIITSTGYYTVDFDLWPELSKTILVVLMFVGACAGSTGGGIKISRIMILLKSIGKEIRLAAHPKSAIKIKMNGRLVEHETVRMVNVYMAAYIVIFAAALLIISLDNFGFTTNFTAIAATINNMGPGLAQVGPTQNFSIYSGLSKIVMTFCMLVGRLEVFPMLILFSPYTWKR